MLNFPLSGGFETFPVSRPSCERGGGSGEERRCQDNRLNQSHASQGSQCLSPVVDGREAGYTLNRSPIHRKEDIQAPCRKSHAWS
ncbi:hypothetical protein ILYODFUR_028082 [Ilyodon furcidens]|uniref:Uncharacterized protein n=1 Tax=Ilyodon furcidens TaxID=33524 RepID=A0ABV0UD91_9TELE